jgi:ketosteroid isomerase-like protein
MKYSLWLLLLFLCPLGFGSGCPGGQAKDGAALAQREQAWAKALEQHNADAVGCILADEFQDLDPDGKLHDRAETLANVGHRKPGSNQLSELQPHVYGDFGYIRGLATLINPDGKTVARVRFTDIYVYRDGRWLAVAGQESRLSQTEK